MSDIRRLSLEKRSGVRASMPYSTWGAGPAHWPSVPNDSIGAPEIVTRFDGHVETYLFTPHFEGLDDVLFTGPEYSGTEYLAMVTIVPYVLFEGPAGPVLDSEISGEEYTPYGWARGYDGNGPGVWEIECVTSAWDSGISRWVNTYRYRKDGGSWSAVVGSIDGLGLYFHNEEPPTEHTVGDTWTVTVTFGDESVSRPDRFAWEVMGLLTGVYAITDGPQLLGYGIGVTFGSKYGHSNGDGNGGDLWYGSLAPGNNVTRPGVAVRGTIDTAMACVNGGHPNNNIVLTCEIDLAGSYVLVVRNADTLAFLYGKVASPTGSGFTYGDPPQKFSFSANAEGLFAMHCYTAPVLGGTPVDSQYGPPNPRRIAVVSVNPLTFEPTIEEIITLADNDHTAGSTFAVMTTLP